MTILQLCMTIVFYIIGAKLYTVYFVLVYAYFHISAHTLHSAILGILGVCNTNMCREGDARVCVAKVL